MAKLAQEVGIVYAAVAGSGAAKSISPVGDKLDVAQEFEVQAMPTFVLLKQGKEVERVVGAKKDELEILY